jgi:DNA-binding MarR family transcriptional regulator
MPKASTRMRNDAKTLHGAMVDLFTMMSEPQRDDTLLREAGVSLDRALFPLLVGIERYGPIGVVDLANKAGRDHTTISRQVSKLESLGLIKRQPGATDRRINQAAITPKGQSVTDALDAARLRLAAPIFAKWSEEDFSTLVRLLRRFADDLMNL